MSETRFDVEVETLSAQLPFEGRSGILLGKPSEPVPPWPEDPLPEGRYYMRFTQSQPATARPASTEGAVAKSSSLIKAPSGESSVRVADVTRASRFRVAAAESTLMNAAVRPSLEQAATTVSTSLCASAVRPSGVEAAQVHLGNVTSGTANPSTGRQGVATASVSARRPK